MMKYKRKYYIYFFISYQETTRLFQNVEVRFDNTMLRSSYCYKNRNKENTL